MSDDWRLRIELDGEEHARELADRLQSGEDEHGLTTDFVDRVIVSVDDNEVFAYTGSREQAERTEELVRSVAAVHGWTVAAHLHRWHPTAEAWEDADEPLPATDAERAAEHEELVSRERTESEQRGYPEYEVRVECRTHGETVKLAEILRQQHLPVVQRWHAILIGAPDEDSARALADRVTQETPAGTTVTVEATLSAIEAGTARNPFAVFRGIWG
jgi:hypothetical protein